ncbi:hypothetical protein So717_05850 [Roseobacter cerasinus]|uniref:Uncharacterized protein n=1 Tax=Roseobacter cerasinus TaxID=2602289 RepID=A0A640VM91_9RHOB|nr:hypothetical protein [Roseobacter cerasinus]GFE48832.1 hypothetical protein So717_05850 [Roseobacter cerasinus]
MIRAAIISLAFAGAAMANSVADSAIASFNALCFTAGKTEVQVRTNMQARDGAPLPYTLIFWDKTLAPAPGMPDAIERRCEVSFEGDHTDAAIAALRDKMATPPVFGSATALPGTHSATAGTAFIEGRALLRGRVAVVHVGTRADQTFMAVDRLPADWESLVQ